MSTDPEARAVCEHFYAAHCYRGMSIRLCMTCHEPDWDDLAEQLGEPEPLILPGGETPWTPEQLAQLRADFDAAMANPGPLRVLPSDRWQARAEAAEAKLAAVEELARQLVTATHPTIGGTFAAILRFKAAIGTEEARDG